ncbi:UNVERIFIED_CONTAM: hypothetical protein Slati_0074400 [Sesamum latifolium]|uniref:Thioredoxin-like protein AAED1, chloroplastic n=1 Tax=Sesamum latifolium TaxID=2727402 RepID=A0AAW2Y7S1_9LAMI
MAKMISPRNLTSSTSLLFPSTHSPTSLHSPRSVGFSTKPISRGRFAAEPGGTSLVAKASSTATAVVPDDIADVLGEVSIFAAAAGQPVKFKDLWDQKEGMAVVALLRHFGCPCCWELAATLKESKEKFDSAGVKLIAVGVGTPDKAQLLAERGMAVVALLRHFGCFFCWEYAEALRESKEKFDLAGVKLIVVGVGTPDKAQVLAERLPFPLDSLYADPDRKAYDILGLYYGFRRTFLNPASAKVFSRWDALKKAMKNYTIKATPDDKSSILQQGGMFVFKGKQLLYARKDEGSGDHAPLDDIFNICCKVPAA